MRKQLLRLAVSPSVIAGDTSIMNMLLSVLTPKEALEPIGVVSHCIGRWTPADSVHNRLGGLVQITHRETIAQINELTGAAMDHQGLLLRQGPAGARGRAQAVPRHRGAPPSSASSAPRCAPALPTSLSSAKAGCEGAVSAQAAAFR